MNSAYAQGRIDTIEFLFDEIDSQKIDPQVISYLSQYLSVFICGVYEDIIENLLLDFVKKDQISIPSLNYIFIALDKGFRNPDEGNIKSLLKKFNEPWVDQLNLVVTRSEWIALNNIVTNKNKIAHGESSNITYILIKDYYSESKKVIIAMDSIIV
jgi:hypothetical protein